MSSGSGTTSSERYLAKLCQRSFLNLWSYPNPHRKRIRRDRTEKEEICDLLVVCGNDVIIFSDKHCRMSESADIATAWARWKKEAITKSIKQLSGAERWIRQHPDQIYLDRQCQKPLPVSLPPADKVRVHRIIVANGARQRCQDHFGGGTGSLIVEYGSPPAMPEASRLFVVNQPTPRNDFVHILDEASVNVLLGELDTITDFVTYLEKKRSFIQALDYAIITGEEELLAYYLLNPSSHGEYTFPKTEGNVCSAWIDEGFWQKLQSYPQYRAKKVADEDSKMWDLSINKLSEDFVTDHSQNDSPDKSQVEIALRTMARERRFGRRMLSRAFIDIVARQFEPGIGCHSRRIVSATDASVGYVFVVTDPQTKDYRQYQEEWRKLLNCYCLIFIEQNPTVNTVVGIATEHGIGRHCRSHVLMSINVGNNRAALIQEARDIIKSLGIGTPNGIVHYSDGDFPSLGGPTITYEAHGDTQEKNSKHPFKKRKKRSR